MGAAAAVLLVPRSGKTTRSALAKHAAQLVERMRPSKPQSAESGPREQASTKLSSNLNPNLNPGAESKAVAEILNSADRHELMSVNGIGKTTATRIMKHRPYNSAEEAVQEGVLPEETLEHVKEELLHKNRDIA